MINKEEILNKYINLIDKGYCSDCNELNCIDNFPHSKITHAIRELQQENKILRENAENNDKVVDKVNWENQLLKKKYENAVADYESVMFEKEQLKERIKYLERSNDRREDTILEQRQEISDLEDNWEIIRQYCLDEQIPEETDEYNSYIEFSNSVYDNILNKMQELEQGSDNK